VSDFNRAGTRTPHATNGVKDRPWAGSADLPNPPDFAGAGAPCTRNDIDPELFFPVGTGGDYLDDQLAQAQAFCDRCPMKQACLLYALEVNATHGVWGGVRLDGLHFKTRRGMRDRLRRSA
jgi:WhiB family transcriptional regulator, redox-sensing transcriptional regulator